MAPSKFQIYVDQSMLQAGSAVGPASVPQQQQQLPQQPQQQPKPQHQQHVAAPTIVTATPIEQLVPQAKMQVQAGDQYQQQQQQQQQQPKEAVVHERSWPRVIKENLDGKNQMFYFDERKIYPVGGGEFSFEELNYYGWMKKQRELILMRRCEEIEAENEDLKQKLDMANQQLNVLANALKQLQQQHLLQQQQLQQQQQQQPVVVAQPAYQQQSLLPTQTLTSTTSLKPPHSPPNNRLSIVPRSLQPAQGNDADTSCYGGINEPLSTVQDWWKYTIPVDKLNTNTVPIDQSQYKNTAPIDQSQYKLTVPIDQSQYIREHCPTSTPNNKEDKAKRNAQRRMSRPSMGGNSPTMKLSPITETSRDCNSKSSSSSSAMSTTPGTVKKPHLVMEPMLIDEPDRPLNPNDPTTYRKLLKVLSEPLDRRTGFIRIKDNIPAIKNGVCFGTGGDRYLVDKELSSEAKMYTAQLLTDDSDSSNTDMPVKTICFRVDQPSNDWLFYVCNELHRRLVRQKTKPDIELSVMNSDPAIFYVDGSILVDEYFRFVPLDDYFAACSQLNKPFPKSVAAYITLELIQLVRGIHSCDIIHMNINAKNIIITGCPTREDIANVDERTSIVKLIGFDHAMDTRLLPADFRFQANVDYMTTSKVLDSKSWRHEIDWLGVLSCIHRMFFLEELNPVKENDRWQVEKQFKGFPTNVWASIYDEFLNMDDIQTTNNLVDRVVDELSTWIKANISFVLKEAAILDMVLEDFCKAANKSVRI